MVPIFGGCDTLKRVLQAVEKKLHFQHIYNGLRVLRIH